MIVLKNHQIEALRPPSLETFFIRVEEFLKEHVPATSTEINYPAFIREHYAAAIQAGRRTERQIVHYILDQLEGIQ